MGKCKLHDVKRESLPALDVTEDTDKDRDHKAKLREATEQVVRRFSRQEPPSYGASCLERYKEHLDFNFLPWEEYLFHFLLARDIPVAKSKKEFARALWTAVRSYPDSTWRFLLELLDGQGRTPINVGFRTSSFFVGVVANAKGEIEDEEVLKCVMAARDGAGRTALHRALATGDAFLVSLMLAWSQYPLVPQAEDRWQHLIPKVVHDWTSRGFLGDSCAKSVNIVSSTNDFNGSSSTVMTKGMATKETFEVPIPGVQSSLLHTAIVHKQGSLLWKKTKVSATEGAPPLCTIPFCGYVLGCSRQKEEARATPKTKLPSPEASKLCEFLRKHVGMLWQAGLCRLKRDKAVDREETVESKLTLEEESKIWQYWGLDLLFPWPWVQKEDGRATVLEVDAVELAALMGDVRAAKCLPLGAYNSRTQKQWPQPRTQKHRPWPALHIAANAGNYEMVKWFLDSPLCDPYIEDWNGNTALHHALNVVTIGKFEPHLLDYVNCEHLQANDTRKENKEISNDGPLSGRRGCITLLVQAGCDIFKPNREGQPPYPKGKLSENPEFVSWWFNIQPKEFDSNQSTLSSAANAISVTATLVATASYVGPLQPPLGLAGDPSQIQDANLWVKVFIFCDTMSFYFAIVAIILSLIPSIPIAQQKVKDEVQRTRLMVATSLIVLFSAIIFVLVAFVSSSIAVVSAGVTDTGGLLTITTASIGGLFCLLAFSLFALRLLAFTCRKSKWVMKIYDATNWTVPNA